MYYTLLVILLWLLSGAPHFAFTINPVFVAFLLAIIADLLVYKPWVRG